jgi:hypothetical protein
MPRERFARWSPDAGRAEPVDDHHDEAEPDDSEAHVNAAREVADARSGATT